MKLERVEIENYRAIEKLALSLDPALTVLHGANGHGKTSVLGAIAAGLSSIPRLLREGSVVGFLETDRRGRQPLRVMLRTRDGIEWDRRVLGQEGTASRRAPTDRRMLKEKVEEIVAADCEEASPVDLPIVAFYDADRTVVDTSRAVADAMSLSQDLKTEFPRYEALQGALTPFANFREFFKWFYAMENEELREKNERRDLDYQLPELRAVRKAITSMVDRVSDPRIKLRPPRFAVSVEPEAGKPEAGKSEAGKPEAGKPEAGKPEAGKPEELALDQLSGGYRIVLALAADLARRMAQGNPHLADPLQSEAIVLIDEVDLHLHPRWQQRILVDLRRTFPNTQFIVSTHSPQVLTTVHPKHVIHLRRTKTGIVAGESSAPTFGAEAGDVLFTVMGVDERPDNEFKTTLDDYMRLVEDGRGECEEAVSLRARLVELSPDAPEIHEAKIEIERRKLLKEMAESR